MNLATIQMRVGSICERTLPLQQQSAYSLLQNRTEFIFYSIILLIYCFFHYIDNKKKQAVTFKSLFVALLLIIEYFRLEEWGISL